MRRFLKEQYHLGQRGWTLCNCPHQPHFPKPNWKEQNPNRRCPLICDMLLRAMIEHLFYLLEWMAAMRPLVVCRGIAYRQKPGCKSSPIAVKRFSFEFD